MERMRAVGLKLYKQHINLETEITYLGEKLTQQEIQVDHSKVEAITGMTAPMHKGRCKDPWNGELCREICA